MIQEVCNPENTTGSEAHHAPRSSFDWIAVGDTAKWFCEDCRLDIEQLQEEK
jgi:hypothetical protein